ncbi:MAG TPA: cupin domain-containing protein [Guyparkeria sp.]|nr:cupin domain-containing protein [Guyparkeria sp.]
MSSLSDAAEPHPVVNIDELELEQHARGCRYEASMGAIGARIGARMLGCRWVVLPPGKRAWPYHWHYANEELFFVMYGTGTLRCGAREYPLRAGDVVAAPPGEAHAHQIINTSGDELRYLAVSTMLEPEIVEYPDSGKLCLFAGAAPGGDKERRTLALCLPRGEAVDYWDGEE